MCDKKVCFKGHVFHGAYLIAYLESLGGINNAELTGNDLMCYYFINSNNKIDCTYSNWLLASTKLITIDDIKDRQYPKLMWTNNGPSSVEVKRFVLGYLEDINMYICLLSGETGVNFLIMFL